MKQIPLLEKKVIVPIRKDEALELEKNNFMLALVNFFNQFSDEEIEHHHKNAIKCLLLMAYHGSSYRKGYSEMLFAQQNGIISNPLKRSAICKYMNSKDIYKLISILIQKSALPFIGINQTLSLDGTWFGTKMYVGGFANKPASKRHSGVPPLKKTRKLHIGSIRDSGIITYAITSKGTDHDINFFKEIVSKTVANGFDINAILADSGYLSRENYEFAQEIGIENPFINFRSNSKFKGGGSKAWKRAFNIYKNKPEEWHGVYRFRYAVEGVFSAIKRRSMNWLRSRNDIARDNEQMLKVLIHNLVIIGKNITC